jgi:Domain of unknown function DUF29
MPRNSVDYEEDFYAWTVEQARLLRASDLYDIDTANIAEELESMGRSDRREIRSRLIVLLTHLLKWRFQPDAKSTSWSGTIREQRQQIELILEDSPSLRPIVKESLARAYADARVNAAEQTGLSEADFPKECPFSSQEIMSRSFYPEPG